MYFFKKSVTFFGKLPEDMQMNGASQRKMIRIISDDNKKKKLDVYFLLLPCSEKTSAARLFKRTKYSIKLPEIPIFSPLLITPQYAAPSYKEVKGQNQRHLAR